MTRKLSKEQIDNIKISNIYYITILGMNFNIAMKIFLYGMGFFFALPGLIKHTILFFWTEQEYLAFYERLPIEISEQIQSFPMLSGIIIIGFTYLFFNILLTSFEKSPDGVIESRKIVEEIIYKGKRVKARIIDQDYDYGVFIKGNRTRSILYSFESVEFNTAMYATLNVGLKLKGEQFVYWHPKYSELVIPSSLVDN